MPQLHVGSDEHKRVFCREFVDTHHAYDPHELQWPDLDDAAVARLRSLPFWGEAIGSERTAAARVRAMADVEPDPVMREAIAMQAYEEERHALLLEHLLNHYGIPFPTIAPRSRAIPSGVSCGWGTASASTRSSRSASSKWPATRASSRRR
jgi:hypothetical protein